MEYQVRDRLSFKKFLVLESGDKVPDKKTVWTFRENITNSGLVEEIFAQFVEHLNSKGLIMNEGKMVDASFTVAPRQRNTREENKPIKQGQGAEQQKASNRKKSKTRARVEQVFGFMQQSMNGLCVRSVGIARTTRIIGLMNLTYNLFRYEHAVCLDILAIKNA